MNNSESIQNIATALRKLQEQLPAVAKDSTGYGYNYASLPEVTKKLYSIMTPLGLSVSQILDESYDGKPAITTVLMHDSGEHISGTYPLFEAGVKGVNNAQQFGAAISYARRYGLLAVTGVPADDDDAACLSEKPANNKKAESKVFDSTMPTVQEMIDAIKASASLAALKGVGKQIKAMNMSDEDREMLRDLYLTREDQIKRGDAA